MPDIIVSVSIFLIIGIYLLYLEIPTISHISGGPSLLLKTITY